jgi:cysteine sulfinate desulfinase/cysteine desulfurase-like protein
MIIDQNNFKKKIKKIKKIKKSRKKSRKKSVKKLKGNSLKKNKKDKKGGKESIDTPCNVIYLDNVNSSSLCTNAEKIYKKSISNKSIKPYEKSKIVKDAKEYLLKICNSDNQYSIFFTSGDIESNTIFLCSTVNAYKKIRKIKPHIVISAVENQAIIKYANSLKDSGQIDLTYIKPNIYGCILSEHVISSIKPNTCCVFITYINKELGSVNNIEKISNLLHEKKIPLHSDCTYLFGKHKLDLKKTNIDAATITFDKISGPVGLGAIIIKNDLLTGYKLHEHSATLENKRNENIPAISSAIESVKYSLTNRKIKNAKLLKFRKEIITKLSAKFQLIVYSDFINSDEPPLEESSKSKNQLIVLGPPTNNESYFTPSILSIALITNKNKSGLDIQTELEKKDIIIGVPEIDSIHIYNEIKMPKEIQNNIIRISLSDDLSQQDINKFITALQKIL